MIKIFSCRRSSIAFIGMALLFILGMTQGKEVASAIALPLAGIAGALSAANAYEGKKDVESDK